MSIDLNKERDRMIVDNAVGYKSKVAVEEVQINHVVTRSMAKAEEEKAEELREVMEECPVVKEIDEVNLPDVEWLWEDEQIDEVEEERVMGASVAMSGKYDNTEEKVKLPYWKEGDDRKKLVDEVLYDKSLRTWRKLADQNLREYSWRDGLLIKKCIDKVTKMERELIVLPKKRTEAVLKIDSLF